MDKREKLRGFLTDLLSKKGDRDFFSDEDSLLLKGRLNSLNVLEIVGFIESEFGFDISEAMFDQDNFDSLASILKFVELG